MAGAAAGLGWEVTPLPMSDGGEGLLDACAAGLPRPGGDPGHRTRRDAGRRRVAARGRDGGGGVGPGLGPGPGRRPGRGNDPVAATSRGTGELLVAAARRVGPGGTVVVGLGGSATTDGGLGARGGGRVGGRPRRAHAGRGLRRRRPPSSTRPRCSAPRRAPDPDQVAVLTERLEALADRYLGRRYGVDVRRPARVPGRPAGLGGALAVLGGTLAVGLRARARPGGAGRGPATAPTGW